MDGGHTGVWGFIICGPRGRSIRRIGTPLRGESRLFGECRLKFIMKLYDYS